MTTQFQAVEAGDLITYTLKIHNPSLHTIENAFVKDVVPNGLELKQDMISDKGVYDPETKQILWNLGAIEAEETKQVSFSVEVPKVDQKRLGKISPLSSMKRKSQKTPMKSKSPPTSHN